MTPTTLNNPSVPLGLCHCGCGGRTQVARYNDTTHGWVKGEPRKFIRGHHWLAMRSGAVKRHRFITANGYVRVRCIDHPRAVNGYVLEHILVAEKALGRFLPLGSPVHHVDGDRTNNAPSNLVVCEDAAYHNLLHRRMRALEASGDPSADVRRSHRSADPEARRLYHRNYYRLHRARNRDMTGRAS